MRDYSGTIALLRGCLLLPECSVLQAHILDVLPKLAEQRAQHYIKVAHGYFMGSWSDGNGGGSGGAKASEKALDKSAGSGIIKAELDKGNITLEINHNKQARHIKGEPEYTEGRSYLYISESEAQEIINNKSGTGDPVVDRSGNWKHKELIDCGKNIGVDIDPNSKEETPTDKATIHYSKSGTYLVPRKEKKS